MKFFIISFILVSLHMLAQADASNTTTAAPTTKATTTAAPTTKASTTAAPTTKASTTAAPTTKVSTTAAPTTKAKSTTTAAPTTKTTAKPTTKATTTAKPTTNATTTAKPTTKATTTVKPTTKATTTAKPTTNATTTAKPTTKPTTTAKPTTKATTTEKPTTKPTTTAKPTTKATTTAKPTTKTTVKPTNGTTAAPTTKAPTTPVVTTKAPTVSPNKLTFNVKSKKGATCLSLKGIITLIVGDKVIKLTQAGGVATGKCSPMKSVNDTSDITLTWAKAKVTLELSFKGGAVWYMSAVSMKSGNFSGSATYGPDSLNKYFQAQSNHSYQCTEDRNVTLKDKKAEGIVDFVSLQVQPFAAKNATSEACPSKVNPNPDNSIVPIAVGCALAGLIVIVLIAYLIGRKKGGGRGYQKV